MKDAPLGKATRDADANGVPVSAPTPFRITNFRRVTYSAKMAEFMVVTTVGTIEVDLFCPEGRQPFTVPRSVLDKYTGKRRRTVQFATTFADALLAAALPLMHETRTPAQ